MVVVVVVVDLVVVGCGAGGVEGRIEEAGKLFGTYREVVLSNVCTLLKELKWLLVVW